MKTTTEISREILLSLYNEYKIYLEGNILKVLKSEDDDTEFTDYLKFCRDRDASFRRKRLEVAKQVQRQVKELKKAAVENDRLLIELQVALDEANTLKETAIRDKNTALQDLELMQKRKRFELINTIVKMALYIVAGVGVATSGIFIFSLANGLESPVIQNTWSNLFGILLTNAFSIIGTLMGVKYANNIEENMGD